MNLYIGFCSASKCKLFIFQCCLLDSICFHVSDEWKSFFSFFFLSFTLYLSGWLSSCLTWTSLGSDWVWFQSSSLNGQWIELYSITPCLLLWRLCLFIEFKKGLYVYKTWIFDLVFAVKRLGFKSKPWMDTSLLQPLML